MGITRLPWSRSIKKASPLPPRDLKEGSRGEDVVELQKRLVTNGFLDGSYVTGYFGPKTRRAVASWQRSKGLPSSGFYGPTSRELMEDLAGTAMESTTVESLPVVVEEQAQGPSISLVVLLAGTVMIAAHQLYLKFFRTEKYRYRPRSSVSLKMLEAKRLSEGGGSSSRYGPKGNQRKRPTFPSNGKGIKTTADERMHIATRKSLDSKVERHKLRAMLEKERWADQQVGSILRYEETPRTNKSKLHSVVKSKKLHTLLSAGTEKSFPLPAAKSSQSLVDVNARPQINGSIPDGMVLDGGLRLKERKGWGSDEAVAFLGGKAADKDMQKKPHMGLGPFGTSTSGLQNLQNLWGGTKQGRAEDKQKRSYLESSRFLASLDLSTHTGKRERIDVYRSRDAKPPPSFPGRFGKNKNPLKIVDTRKFDGESMLPSVKADVPPSTNKAASHVPLEAADLERLQKLEDSLRELKMSIKSIEGELSGEAVLKNMTETLAERVSQLTTETLKGKEINSRLNSTEEKLFSLEKATSNLDLISAFKHDAENRLKILEEQTSNADASSKQMQEGLRQSTANLNGLLNELETRLGAWEQSWTASLDLVKGEAQQSLSSLGKRLDRMEDQLRLEDEVKKTKGPENMWSVTLGSLFQSSNGTPNARSLQKLLEDEVGKAVERISDDKTGPEISKFQEKVIHIEENMQQSILKLEQQISSLRDSFEEAQAGLGEEISDHLAKLEDKTKIQIMQERLDTIDQALLAFKETQGKLTVLSDKVLELENAFQAASAITLPAPPETKPEVKERHRKLNRLELGTEILLQGFHWDSHQHQWYSVICGLSHAIEEAGFTGVWLPPPSDSLAPQGYLPRDLYNLDSAYGSMHELKNAISCLHEVGLHAICDVVINHRCATSQGKDGAWNRWDGVSMSWDEHAVCEGSFSGMGKPQTGEDFHAAPNIDHSQEFVQNDIVGWLKWLQEEIGFDSFRFDFAKGYSGAFTRHYLHSVTPELSIGEVWETMDYDGCKPKYDQDRHRQGTVDWIDSTDGLSAAFDFTTKGILQEACGAGEWWRLKDREGRPPGLIGLWPSHACTFIDNHDTGSSQSHWPFPSDKVALGYAYVLTHPGIPMVFWEHFFDWGQDLQQEIRKLISLRKQSGIHSRSKVTILQADDSCYAAQVGDALCVKLGGGDWSPNHSSGWSMTMQGREYTIWSRH